MLGISGELEVSRWTKQGVSIVGDVETDLPLVGEREERLLNLKHKPIIDDVLDYNRIEATDVGIGTLRTTRVFSGLDEHAEGSEDSSATSKSG